MKLPAIKTITLCVICLVGATLDARAADVKENWQKNCLTCHGPDGQGNTKMGKKIGIKDLTDSKVQSSFTDEQAFAQIKAGLKEGDKEKMKPFGGKLTDEEIKALVAHVRSLKKN